MEWYEYVFFEDMMNYSEGIICKYGDLQVCTISRWTDLQEQYLLSVDMMSYKSRYYSKMEKDMYYLK